MGLLSSHSNLNKVETSALTWGVGRTQSSRADPTNIPFTVSTPRSAELKYTASPQKDVNLDLGGWLGWELKGSTVEPKGVVSALWL